MDHEDDIESRVLSVRTRTARKEHHCDGCGGTIKPGERYNLHAVTIDGEFVVQKLHTPYCEELWEEDPISPDERKEA